MTTTIRAGQLRDALQKAQGVGRVEEELVIDGCHLILQSLKPDEYNSINDEVEGLEDLEYFHGFVVAHVSRAVCEIDEMDLRDVQFIEDVAPKGVVVWGSFPSEDIAKQVAQEIEKAGGTVRTIPADASDDARMVKYERHDWIHQNVLSTWSREALNVAWRKFAEVLEAAEEKAKLGVKFHIPEETVEDKFRRLLNEVRETSEDLPVELYTKALKDAGLMAVSSAEEIAAATARIDEMATPTVAQRVTDTLEEATTALDQAQASTGATQAASAASAVQPQPEAAQAVPAPPQAPPTAEELHTMMQTRQRMNQAKTVAAPVPQQLPPTAARERVAVPDQIRRAAMEHSASLTGRAAKIAQLEGSVDPSMAVPPDGGQLPIIAKADIPTLEPQAAVEGRDIAAITEQPPKIGINPRFKPPPRG